MIDDRRIKQLNAKDFASGSVLYWMNRDCRVHDNWALLRAQKVAKEHNAPFVVVYNLELGFLGGSLHQHTFKIEGLQEVEKELKEKNIPFAVISGTDTHEDLVSWIKENDIGYIVTDFSPLRIQKKWAKYVTEQCDTPFEIVDAHNIVPAWVTSDKKEYAARTIRPKLHKLLPEFLTNFPYVTSQDTAPQVTKTHPDWETLTNTDKVTDRHTEVVWKGGESEAKKVLDEFLEKRFKNYAEDRNDPNLDVQSDLSPYLHYGHISAQRVALKVVDEVHRTIETILDAERNGASTTNNASAFLEELIIRRELSDNFCWYEPHYDSSKSFPSWAKESLQEHAGDKREYIYTKKEFEQAKTHDELWNACQRQMTHSGKMHGYMRMYWAKKILEWTKNPDDAMDIAIYLNDTYELDGRDPNGYAGIAWSMGGVHDRPWFDREVFGKVRYMNRSGCEKKFDVDEYIQRWN